MIKKRKTKQVRVYAELDNELRIKFPKVRSADLYQTMYDTSALKLESKLRKNMLKRKIDIK